MITNLPSGRFFGEVLARRHFGDIVLTATRHRRSHWLPVHSHQNAYFCLVRRGQFAERIGQQERLCKPMVLTFHPPEERHSQQIQSQSSSSFNIEIQPALLLRLQSYSAQPLEPCALQAPPVINLTLRLQNEFEQNDTTSSLAVEGLSLALLAELLRSQRSEKAVPKWLLRVRCLLHDRFHGALDLPTLAEEAGVHPVYLVQCFRRQFHCTPGEYQRQLRVDAAKEKLLSSGYPISEIALLTGFADQSHLTRVFRRHTGMTPAAFRRSARA